MSEEKPKVRVFLSDIFQEFPPSAVRPQMGRPRSPRPMQDDPWHNEWSGDWRTNWPNDWAGNWVNNSSDVRFTSAVNPALLRDLLLRREDFGGIAYSPTSKRVYSFNPSGFSLLQKLQEGVAKASLLSESLTEDDLNEFLVELEKQGIIYERS